MHLINVQHIMANLSRIWNVLFLKGQTGGVGKVQENCSLMAISADFLIIRPPTTMIRARFKTSSIY